MATRAQIMSLAAARRGARFLDKRYGSKRQWRRLIKRRELRLESVCNCVLGQLEGDYNRGRERFDLGYLDAGHLGFDTDGTGKYDHDDLTEAWKRAIREGL